MIFPLIGNEKICSTVTSFVNEKRIPHAVLILGDFGTGKHTLSKYLSKAIVCSGDNIPCGLCNNCRTADSGNHPDITVISPEEDKKSITVAQVRDLINEAYIMPHSAQKRVFILDPADSMNAQAQNALLKVLEEPPKTVMFILIAENKGAFLDTVISRCAVINLTVPEHSAAVNYLSQNTKYDLTDIDNALNSVQNNIGRAMGVLKGKSNIKAENTASEFLKYLLKNDQYQLLLITNSMAKNRLEADKFVSALKSEVSKKVTQDVNSHFAKPLTAFYDKICELEQALNTNINLNLFFSSLVCDAIQIVWRNK